MCVCVLALTGICHSQNVIAKSSKICYMFPLLVWARDNLKLKNTAKEYNFCANSSHILDMELKEMINFLSGDTCFYDFKNFFKLISFMMLCFQRLMFGRVNLFYPWIHLEKLILKKINEMATKVAYRLKVTMTK